MNVIKRFLLLWVLSMVILPLSAVSYDFIEDGICYKLLSYGNFVEVTQGKSSYKGDIVIPTTVTHNGQEYYVVGIGDAAFDCCGNVTSVKMPETISSIGQYAFRDCKKLKEIHIPKGVSTLSLHAFENCTALQEIRIPSSVVKIQAETAADYNYDDITYHKEYGCFYNCTNLKKVIFEDGATPITFYRPGWENQEFRYQTIFYGCPIEEVYFGRQFANSSNNFKKFSTLKKVKIGPYVKSLQYGFLSGTGVKKVVVPDNVTKMSGAFYECTTLEELYVGNGVTDLTLQDIKNLKHVYIGNNLESLYFNTGDDSGCKKLEDIVITSSKIGKFIEHSKNRNGVKIYLPQKDMYSNDITKGEKISIADYIGTTQEYTGNSPKLNFSTKIENAEISVNIGNLHKNAGIYKENVPVEIKIGDWKSSFDTEVSYTISKAPLTVIAENVERPYGSEKQDLTVSYFGFKNGEDESVLTKPVSISTTAKKDSPVGTYPIVPFGGLADNYDLSYERGVLTIVKAAQTIAWNDELPAKATVGTKIKLEATTTSGLPVSFKSSDESVANVSVIGGEQYLICKKAGDVDIIAYQEGNKNYEAAPNETRNLTIVKTAQTITWLSELPTETTVGTKIKLEATATSGLPVSFKSSDESVASISYTSGAYYLTCKKAGNVDITAYQEGDDNYSAAPEDVHNLTVVRTAQTISWLSELPTETTVGTKIKLEATATSGLPVSFKSSDESVASISSTGGAYYLICKKAGYVDVTAYQDGDDKYEAAPYEEHNLRVVKIAQTIDWKGELPAEAHVGTKIKLEATATSGLTVAFKSSDESVASISVTGGVCYLICKKTGNVNVTAYQEGDDKYEAAPDEIRNITVIPSSGIVDATVNLDGSEKIYDTNGNLLEKCQRGVNIIRYPDGRTKKVVIK